MEKYDLLIGEVDYSNINNKEYTLIDFNDFNTFQMFFEDNSVIFKGISLSEQEFIFKITDYNIFYRDFLNLLDNDDSKTFKSSNGYITIYKNYNDIIINIKDNNKKYVEDNVISLDYNDILMRLSSDINNTFDVYKSIDKGLIDYINDEIASKFDIEKMRHVSYVLRRMIDICIENKLRNIDYNIIYALAFYNEIDFDSSTFVDKKHIFKDNELRIIEDVLAKKINSSADIYPHLLKVAKRELNLKRQIISSYNHLLSYFNNDRREEDYELKIKHFLFKLYSHPSFDNLLTDSEYITMCYNNLNYISTNDLDGLINSILSSAKITQKKKQLSSF